MIAIWLGAKALTPPIWLGAKFADNEKVCFGLNERDRDVREEFPLNFISDIELGQNGKGR